LILLLFAILIFIYSLLIFVDYQGPTSIYDTKLIRISENLIGNFGQTGGRYIIVAEYKSKGVISSNKPIEFFIYSVEYILQKEQFKSLVGTRNIWPDNLTVNLCPDNIIFNGDSLHSINPCTNGVLLEKKYEDNLSIIYYNKFPYMYNIEFVSSGQKALSISSILPEIPKEKVFEIEPYNTYLQIQLQKYMYIIALLGFVVILFQIYEFIIKYFKK